MKFNKFKKEFPLFIFSFLKKTAFFGDVTSYCDDVHTESSTSSDLWIFSAKILATQKPYRLEIVKTPQEVKYPVRLEGELLRELSRSVGNSERRLEHVGRDSRKHLRKKIMLMILKIFFIIISALNKRFQF